MDILLLFFLLQIKHTYADFKLQTYQQTVRKGIYRDLVGISHSLEHIWATIITLLIYNIWFQISAITIITLAVLEGIFHYHIDWIKVKWGSKDVASSDFWFQFGIDQLAHQITYGIIMLCVLLQK